MGVGGGGGGALGLLALLQETWCGSFRERAALEGSPFLEQTKPCRSSEKHSARKDPGEGRNEGTYCRRWWKVARDPYCKFWVDGKLLLQPWEDPPVPALERAQDFRMIGWDRAGAEWQGNPPFPGFRGLPGPGGSDTPSPSFFRQAAGAGAAGDKT